MNCYNCEHLRHKKDNSPWCNKLDKKTNALDPVCQDIHTPCNHKPSNWNELTKLGKISWASHDSKVPFGPALDPKTMTEIAMGDLAYLIEQVRKYKLLCKALKSHVDELED
jgi:hypothetical protein